MLVLLQWSLLGLSAVWEWSYDPAFRKQSQCPSLVFMWQRVSETLDYIIILSWLIAWEYFIAFSIRKRFKPYVRFQVLAAASMKAIRPSETSVHSNETRRRYIPEDSKLQTLLYTYWLYQGFSNWVLDSRYCFTCRLYSI
jgi:hypothetical protein